jgi:hypothetical protein
LTVDVDDLIDEFLEEKEYVEFRKPYWLFLDSQEEMEWGLFNYFPEAHYKKAIDQAFQERAERRLNSKSETDYQSRVDDQ